jgi:hypothetical protein
VSTRVLSGRGDSFTFIIFYLLFTQGMRLREIGSRRNKRRSLSSSSRYFH